MAADHALALCLAEGRAVLRLYEWLGPTVSLGRNEPAAASYDRHAALARGIDFVRRPTGGRAVLHDSELTYAVVVPLRALGGPRLAYRDVNACLAAALRELGVDASVTETGRTLRPDGGPCFAAAAPGEVVAHGRKRIGSAQARIGRALLQHGSILLGTDQDGLRGLVHHAQYGGPSASEAGACRGAPAPAAPAISIDEVANAVAMSVRRTFGGGWVDGGYDARELLEADRLEREIYGRDSWTWRR